MSGPLSLCCVQCSVPLTGRQRRFCSVRCCDIYRGNTRAEPFPTRTCALDGCDAPFTPRRETQRCCSEKHGKRLWRLEHPLQDRGEWNDAKRARYHKRRALKKGAKTGAPVHLAAIAERDAWRCHLCDKRVNPDLKWPHLMSASLDHVVPLSQGGSHDPLNVRLAHLTCNSRKGARRSGDQLLLFA